MAKGKCAGCGVQKNSSKIMNQHIVVCEKYLEIYKIDPSRALSPEAEFLRYQNEDNNEEAKAERKDKRLSSIFEEIDTKREAQTLRWKKPKSILDD
jgi:hypothetical protein